MQPYNLHPLPPQVILSPGDCVLEVPCGVGDGLLDLASPDLLRVGIDPIPANLQQARQRTAQQRQQVTWLPGFPWSIPFADGSYTLVLSRGGLEVAPDPLDVLVELTRLLEPGGYLLLSSLAMQHPTSIGLPVQRAWDERAVEAWCVELGLCVEVADGLGWRCISRG
ncbi:MAG: methyltransferase domain-containing protein [Myxococcota bacterium]